MKKQTFILKNHHQEKREIKVQAKLEIEKKTIKLEFNIVGERKNYIFPSISPPKRAKELWKATCFELFFTSKNQKGYYEINISPSKQWNIYTFKGYRDFVTETEIASNPIITMSQQKDEYTLLFESTLDEVGLTENLVFNLAVILLDSNNIRHFYAINRTLGAVDFHNREMWERAVE